LRVPDLRRFVRDPLSVPRGSPGVLAGYPGFERMLTRSPGAIFPYLANASLVVQHNTQEGIVNFDFAVVSDEAQFSELVHEKIHSGPRRTNHFREHPLGQFGKHPVRFRFLAVASKQQKSPGQPFLGRIEQLIDQIFLDLDVPRKNVSQKALGERMLRLEHANHLVFRNDQHGGRGNRGRRRHANGLSRKAPFPKEITRSKNPYNGLFAGLIDHDKLDAAFLNVHDILRGIALREDGFFSFKLGYRSPDTG
jgi:hypothetical protein